uniref:tripartite tricarboxylate transporter substrate-binding protein n=1 Tax=Cupriavidus sp. WGlv3 TaxID=2919924 RepID=UPI0020903350|nr:tripartite tricarboxylate transporter substrate-binding protein [Cupriavidus sp. WGlv3]
MNEMGIEVLGDAAGAVARLVSTQMSKTLGQSIVIDNRAGAGGNIGTDIASRTKPDASTIMLATVASHGLNSALYSRLNHDPIKGLCSNWADYDLARRDARSQRLSISFCTGAD